MKIILAKEKVLSSLGSWGGTELEKTELLLRLDKAVIGFSNSVRLDTEWCPITLLKHLLDVCDNLTERQRAQIRAIAYGVDVNTDMVCSKPSDVHTLITSLKITGAYNAEVELNGRWYPVIVTSNITRNKDEGGLVHCWINVKAKMVDRNFQQQYSLTSYDFEDDSGAPIRLSGKEVLRRLKLRHVTQDVPAFDRKVARAEHVAQQAGRLLACTNSVLVSERGMWNQEFMVTMNLGSRSVPKKVVIEPTLDTEGRYREQDVANVMPFVRAFSLELKRYVYIDVDDTEEYKFDDRALDWLVLPGDEKRLLDRLFRAAREPMFGDVLQDKHGGMIIMANGPTGVGKTLTAEVFAEVIHAPLYVMEMAELGIDVNKIEENLAKIFRRVTRWGAVLLLDEADVFLAERGSDLTRAIIVGIFLRLMDYYKGLMFLTSNRAEVIDPAFKSRITLQVNYPTLDRAARESIWKILLDKADVTVSNGLDGVPDVEINGRQVRNLVRLVKVLYGRHCTNEQLLKVCQFACR